MQSSHIMQPFKDDFFLITARVFPGKVTLQIPVEMNQLGNKMSEDFKSTSQKVRDDVSVLFFFFHDP